MSFLLLAAVPSLLLSLYASWEIARARARIRQPGIEKAFHSQAKLYGEFVDRYRREAERLLDELPVHAPAGGLPRSIGDLLERAGFDLAAYEVPEPPGSRLFALGELSETPPEGAPAARDWEALARGRRPPTRLGPMLRFFRHRSNRGEPARAVGVLLRADVAEALDQAAAASARYPQILKAAAAERTAVWALSATVFLLAALAAALVARRTARRIGRPVRDLALAAERIAGGDLASRADVEAEGEIGELVSAFNRMAAQLERSREERIRMERIAAWRDAARRIAHEIRNPLTPVRLALLRLRRQLPEDPQAQECLEAITEEVENLTRMSEAFSEFARLPEARPAPTDVAALARSVLDLFRETAGNIRLTYEGPESLRIVGDAGQLRRALTNLLKNALEALGGAGSTGGTVWIRVRRRRECAALEVADDGPGIPEEIRASFFQPGVSARPGGSGLGLAVVQQIAADHGGRIRWEESSPGTRFILEIPCSPRGGE